MNVAAGIFLGLTVAPARVFIRRVHKLPMSRMESGSSEARPEIADKYICCAPVDLSECFSW